MCRGTWVTHPTSSKAAMKKHILLIPGFVIAVACYANGDSWWPQFRGPNSSGVSESASPPIEFGPGTNQLWKISSPPGASSPCIWSDRIYLTAFESGKLVTLCYTRSDGTLLWKGAANAEK